MHGWLVIDKPVGPGSTDIVSKVKRALREGGYPKTKVGHGGTLDPLASGVLPIALGEATKLCGRMLDADKVYDFTIRFGTETDTLDAEGEIVARAEGRPTLEQVERALGRFTGEIEQVPPAYSAIKLGGKPAYARARAGEAVEPKARKVTVRDLAVVASAPDEVTLAATVSKGTYIRSLARDIARALDTVGHVVMLRRTRAGPFGLEQAISLDKLGEVAKARTLDGAVLPLVAGLDDIPALPVTPEQARLLQSGQRLTGTPAPPGLHLAMDDERPVALVEVSAGDVRVVRGFNL